MVRNWRAHARDLLSRAGWELKRSPDIFFIKQRGIDLVIDVGANEGQYAQSLRMRGYKGEIRSFEPAGDPYAKVSRKAASDPLWTVERYAVGAQPGEAELNISQMSVFNSFKSLSQTGERAHESIGVITTEKVPVARLDDLVPDIAGRRIFLKVDTQGFEREVLDGAGAILTCAEGLMLELTVEHFYNQVWTLDEALSFLRNKGFVPAQFRQAVPMPGDPTSACEFDCVFRRRDPVPADAPAS